MPHLSTLIAALIFNGSFACLVFAYQLLRQIVPLFEKQAVDMSLLFSKLMIESAPSQRRNPAYLDRQCLEAAVESIVKASTEKFNCEAVKLSKHRSSFNN